MNPITTRRNFLKLSLAASAGFGLPRIITAREQKSATDAVRLGIIGLGGTKTPGGVGGRGHQLIARLRDLPGAKIVALCDIDSSFLDRELKPFKDRSQAVETYGDLRELLDNKNIDAVVVATPNHWHALATIWACQAGKDVYVEKPFSYNLWEGRQMVAAARKYGRIVQVGTQNRSSTLLRRTFEDLRSGQLGPIRYIHALVYRPRDGIGQVSEPTPIPPTVNYDLWCGPAPKSPLMRKQLHYEWHWFWATGGGEMGNNGIHVIDIARWALGQTQTPPRAMSIGGRLGFNDCGETANTHIALLDYQPAPIICEVRNLTKSKNPDAIGKFRNQTSGLVIDCEGGYFAGEATGGAFFDKQGNKIKDITDDGQSKRLEEAHLSNFISAVHSRKSGDLAAEALEGHLSTACCHMANVSYRLGRTSPSENIREKIHASTELTDAFERCRGYLHENGVDLSVTPVLLGPWVNYDAKKQQFVGDDADGANKLSQRDYRKPFEVPKLA